MTFCKTCGEKLIETEVDIEEMEITETIKQCPRCQKIITPHGKYTYMDLDVKE